ncbi:MAG: hypothetical protein LLG13_11020 [Bacteroidales bacterium]|nr:hypothetical protein [Bacteroidales bacterium]
MSFTSDIKHLMTTDASLNSMCEGRIKYELLPVNYDYTKDWIVYSFNKLSQISSLDNSVVMTQYGITISLRSMDSNRIEEMNDYVVSYLNGNSYNNIRDITFESDNHTVDSEKDVYTNTLQFNSLYS